MTFIIKHEKPKPEFNQTYDLYELQEVELEDGTTAIAKKLVETISTDNLGKRKANLEKDLAAINAKLKLIADLEKG